jgi:hypothetical protein
MTLSSGKDGSLRFSLRSRCQVLMPALSHLTHFMKVEKSSSFVEYLVKGLN